MMTLSTEYFEALRLRRRELAGSHILLRQCNQFLAFGLHGPLLRCPARSRQPIGGDDHRSNLLSHVIAYITRVAIVHAVVNATVADLLHHILRSSPVAGNTTQCVAMG